MDQSPQSLQHDTIPEEVQSVSPQHNWNRTFTYILIGSILVLSSLSAWFFFNKQQTNSDNTNPIPDPNTTASPTKQDWGTHTSQTLGFSVEYPPDITPEERDGTVVLTKWGPTQKENTEFYDGISLTFEKKTLDENSLEIFAQDDLDDMRQHAEITKELTGENINGTHGYSYSFEGLGKATKTFLPTPNGYVLVITNATLDPAGQGFDLIVTRILSTLNFTQMTENTTPSISSESE